MTKVEELTGKIIANVVDGIKIGENDPIALSVATQQVNALIAAVHEAGVVEGIDMLEDSEVFARGRAEGAAEERERIERAGEVFNGTNFDSAQRWFMIPASVFTPKEAKP